VRQDIGEGLRSGRYQLPRRVGIAYRLSAGTKAFVPELGRVLDLGPHVVLYAPYLRNSDIGTLPPAEVRPGQPVILSEGEFDAQIVMPVPETDTDIPPVAPDPVLDSLTVGWASDLPPLLPADQEVSLALSAAPAHLAEGATVYVLQRGGYVKAKEGTNGFSCLVERGHPLSLYPICYDPEGSATILPVSLRRATLREQGKRHDEIERNIGEGFRRGTFRAPRRPGLAYMLSRRGRFEDLRTGRLTGWAPHVMFYAPYVRREDIGAIEEGPFVRRLPVMEAEGEPHAFVVVNLSRSARGSPQ